LTESPVASGLGLFLFGDARCDPGPLNPGSGYRSQSFFLKDSPATSRAHSSGGTGLEK
jgi:hypothetical protein